MTESPLLRAAALSCLLALSTSCDLFDTFDDELGEREARPNQVYGGTPTDSIRLGLQWFNGCAVYPTGQPVGRGQLDIPYPETCEGTFADPILPPSAPIPLVSGTRYFLGQIALTQV